MHARHPRSFLNLQKASLDKLPVSENEVKQACVSQDSCFRPTQYSPAASFPWHSPCPCRAANLRRLARMCYPLECIQTMLTGTARRLSVRKVRKRRLGPCTRVKKGARPVIQFKMPSAWPLSRAPSGPFRLQRFQIFMCPVS